MHVLIRHHHALNRHFSFSNIIHTSDAGHEIGTIPYIDNYNLFDIQLLKRTLYFGFYRLSNWSNYIGPKTDENKFAQPGQLYTFSPN